MLPFFLHPPSILSARLRRWIPRALTTATLVCALSPALALPPEVEADRLLLEAANELEKQEKAEPVVVLRALEAAEATGVKMPENFNFHVGRALVQVREFDSASVRLSRYLSAQGKSAKFYKDALEWLTAAQNAMAAEKRRGVWERFEWHDKAAGELRDRSTGLIWQVCNSGWGTWNGRACSGGEVKYTIFKAKEVASSHARYTGKAWRLPTQAELQSVAGQFPTVGVLTWTQTVNSNGARMAVSEGSALDRAAGKTVADSDIVHARSAHDELHLRLVR